MTHHPRVSGLEDCECLGLKILLCTAFTTGDIQALVSYAVGTSDRDRSLRKGSWHPCKLLM